MHHSFLRGRENLLFARLLRRDYVQAADGHFSLLSPENPRDRNGNVCLEASPSTCPEEAASIYAEGSHSSTNRLMLVCDREPACTAPDISQVLVRARARPTYISFETKDIFQHRHFRLIPLSATVKP